MKVLILNGSPHVNGDTRYLIDKVKDRLPEDAEYEELQTYHENIKPCIGCNYCCENKGCSIKDRMEIVLKDDYDILIIASPIHMGFVSPPLFSLFTRLNSIWCNNHFLNQPNEQKRKKGILILSGGGTGSPKDAIRISKMAFRQLNVDFDLEKDFISSLRTDTKSVIADQDIPIQIERTVNHILSNSTETEINHIDIEKQKILK